MEFKNIPSYASDYEFVICYKGEEKDPDTYYFYAVATNGFTAEHICDEIRNNNCDWEPIIIHNVRIQGVRTHE